MFARIAECIPILKKQKDDFLKKLRPVIRTQPVAAGNGMTHEEAMLEWARGLTLILFLVLIVLVISVAGK